MKQIKFTGGLILCSLLVGIVFPIEFSYAQTSPVTVKISTDKTSYDIGESVVMTITAVNSSDKDAILSFSSSKQTDYVIDGKFRWSSDKYFLTVFTEVNVPARGEYAWTMTHKNSDYSLATGSHTITGEVVGYGSANVQITVGSATLSITTASLSSGTLGTNYSASISASGGSDSYAWSVSSGALPPGLSLNQPVCIAWPCQAPVGISGTPTTAGSYTFTITVKSGTQTASKQFTITVGSAQDITPPDTFITSEPKGEQTSRDATFVFSGTDNLSNTNNLTYSTYLQGYDSGWSIFSSQTSKMYTNLPNGTYAFFVKARDEAGNIDLTPASANFSFAITQNLSFKVLTDKSSYTQDENIIITIQVKNNSSQSATLNFPSSYQTDYVIDGKFRWSSDKVFTQALTSVALEPSGIKEWNFTHTATQYKLETGTHTIIGEVVGYGSTSTIISILPSPTDVRYFQYVMTDNINEWFIVKMTNPTTIQQALDDLNGVRRLIVSGIVNSGNGGFNSPWGWHLDPATIVLSESFIELCDARPSYIEAHLAEWLGQRYCPWGARVKAVYNIPPAPTVSAQPAPAVPATSTAIQVQVNALNVRQNGALSAPKIGLVRQGEVLKKLEEKNDWVKVQLPSGQIGWVFGQYVAPTTAPAVSTSSQKVIVTAWVLNVRSGPGVNNKITTTVQRNNVLEKIEEKDGWIRVILPSGQGGWVYGKFVK